MAVEGETVSHCYILVIRNFIARFYAAFQTVCGFPFLFNNFPLQSLEYIKDETTAT